MYYFLNIFTNLHELQEKLVWDLKPNANADVEAINLEQHEFPPLFLLFLPSFAKKFSPQCQCSKY